MDLNPPEDVETLPPELLNDSNKQISAQIQALKIRKRALKSKGNDLKDRTNILQAHLKNVKSEIYHTQVIVGAKEKEIETENHFRMIGGWKKNLIWGNGKYYRRNGTLMFEGNFYKGQRNGMGINFYSSGDIYKGGWKDDMKHGRGLMEFHSRTPAGVKNDKKNKLFDYYEGAWEKDRRNGKGVMYYNFVNKVDSKKREKYEGYWKNDKKHGNGELSVWVKGLYESVERKEGEEVGEECDGEYAVLKKGFWENDVFNEKKSVVNIEDDSKKELIKEEILKKKAIEPKTIRNWKNDGVRGKYFEKRYDKLKDATVCVVCLVEKKDVLFFPCKHICCCNPCAEKIKDCPVCRVNIKERVKVFL